jgi:hypothetical protein
VAAVFNRHPIIQAKAASGNRGGFFVGRPRPGHFVFIARLDNTATDPAIWSGVLRSPDTHLKKTRYRQEGICPPTID